VDSTTGRIEGANLEEVAKFLRLAEAPLFELDYDGRLFCRCRLHTEAADKAILFTFEEVVEVEPFRSDPNASSA